MARRKIQAVDQFIAAFPRDVRRGLRLIRDTIRASQPKAEEVISYGIPAYKLNGWLVYFTAHKEHYSIAIPPPSAVFDAFKKQLAGTKRSVSTVQFPFSRPLPIALIKKMVAFRAKENKHRASSKG